jgi:membrane protein DedA with SNARE-associated domain
VAVLASIVNAAEPAGYPALFLLVMAESGGVPVPGETALIAAAIVASQGQLDIELVVAIAAFAAIVGDNAGYLISRKAGRNLLEWPGPFERRRRRVLETGEPFFQRHGRPAVFFGRWILGLRTSAITAFGLFALVAVVASASANVLLRRLRRSPPTSRRTG